MIPVLFLMMIGLPLLEIVVFIIVAHNIGWINALSITLFTTFLGLFLARWHSYKESTGQLNRETPRSREMLVMYMFPNLSANLLIIPGFITDFLGLLLLIPPVRNIIFYMIAKIIIKEMFKKNNFNTIFKFSNQFSQGDDESYYDHSQNDSDNLDNNNQQMSPKSIDTPFTNRNDYDKNNNDDDIIDVEFEVKNKH